MTPAGIDSELATLFGEVDWTQATGVLHIAAVTEPSHRAIIPGPPGPASATDRFLLGVARARADVILTTGAILRAEPELRHDYGESPELTEGLARWRKEKLERDQPPQLVLLSGSGRFPIDHPALRDAQGLIWTTEVGRAAILGQAEEPRGERLGGLAIHVGEDSSDGVSQAIDYAFARLGARTVSVEAGPQVAGALYGPSETRCDELLLSTFDSSAGEIAQAALGPAFIPRDALDRCFPDAPTTCQRTESSGAWRFERYLGGRTIGQSRGPSGTSISPVTSNPKR